MKNQDILTTGEVADVCGVSQHTVINWCDKGLLVSHRIPGSSHRRIHRKELQAFIDRNLLTVPAIPAE